MKKVNFLLMLLMFTFGVSFSQNMVRPVLKGYEGRDGTHLYFDSVNKHWRCGLETVENYHFFAVFCVDEKGTTTDVQFTEVRGNEVPEVFKGYVRTLIKSTDGKWRPQSENGTPVMSDELVFRDYPAKKECNH